MKTINTITGQNVKFLLFPDNQPHVNIKGVEIGESVRVVCPIRSSLELVQLMEISNAIDHCGAIRQELVIPYLMGARSDRLMVEGDSVDIEVVASAINSCGFNSVNLFDVHSDVAVNLITNSRNHNNSKLVQLCTDKESVLICPDKGAAPKVSKIMEWNGHFKSVVYCEKARDLSNGRITLTVLEPEKCRGKHCVIVDDLCDGGGTFIAIASQIIPLSLTLCVSHGIFSKGFNLLEQHFTKIWTTDSYRDPSNESKIVSCLNLCL